MNPLMELKERLVYISIAGTQLLNEDFRLKKSIQSFAPLAEKNPVFKKIYTDLDNLMSAAKDKQGILLMNLLGLIDAVLYTQAASNIEGELTEFSTSVNLGEIIQVRYSEMKPLIDALTTTGSGRIEVLKNTIMNNPHYLADYRIIDALIKDLCDPYGEMADLIYSVLECMCTKKTIQLQDPDNYYKTKPVDLPQIDKAQLLAQLKRNFDPQGKKEMVKRFSLIASLAKESENDWYLSLLDEVKKEMRESVIYALQYKKENIPLLLEMVKKERGKARGAVYDILAINYTPDLFDFWKNEIIKNPSSVQHLKNTKSDEISDLIADTLKEELEKCINQNNTATTVIDIDKTNIGPLTESLENKTSEKIFELYKWIIQNYRKMPRFQPKCYILELMAPAIIKTLAENCPKELSDFLSSLNPEEQKLIPQICFISDILTLSAADFYDKWSYKDIWVYANASQLENYFNHISYRDGEYFFFYSFYNWTTYVEHKIKEPLDIRWLDFFIKHKMNSMLVRFDVQGDDKQKEKVGEYFYKMVRSMQISSSLSYTDVHTVVDAMRMMNKYGYNKFEGLISGLYKKHSTISVWNLQYLFRNYYIYAGEELAQKEAENVLEYLEKHDSTGKTTTVIKEMLIEEGYLKV